MAAGHQGRGGGVGVATDFALARYSWNGSLDPTFDSDGKVTTDFGDADYGYDLALQQDGRLVVVGATGSDFALARYSPNGTLDAGFGAGGMVTTDLGGTDTALAVAVESNGRIVVAGRTAASGVGPADFALARYKPDGSLDESFDGDGKVTMDFGDTDDFATDLAIQSDGKVVVVGETRPPAPALRLRARPPQPRRQPRHERSRPLPRRSFRHGGRVTTDFAGAPDTATAVAIEPGGKIVVVGHALGAAGNFKLARYNVNGSLDEEFGTGGKVSTSFTAGADQARDVAVERGGGIIVAGNADYGSASSDFALARYLAAPGYAVGGGTPRALLGIGDRRPLAAPTGSYASLSTLKFR